MIMNYRYLFEALNQQKIKYFIFKGIEHLEEDLTQANGDIDIFVSKDNLIEFNAIVKKNGFFKSEGLTSVTNTYFSIDIEKNKFLMLDVFCELPLWINKHENISLNLDYDDIDVQFSNISNVFVPIIQGNDRILHNALYYFLKTDSDLCYGTIYDAFNLEGSILKSILSHLIPINNSMYEKLPTKEHIIKLLKKAAKSTASIKYNTPAKLIIAKRKCKRFFGLPPNHCHSGILMVVVGVDGAGKSSLIERVINNKFFEATGVKKIYFGHNEFKIPFVLEVYKFLAARPRISILRVLPAILMNIERRFRLLKANLLTKCGNVVVCDRYFYDDEVYYRSITGKNDSVLKQYIERFLRITVTRLPDLAFYLDVSPNVAFERKQDFDYEKMKTVNLNYQKHMKSKSEAIFIDADKDANDVYHNILNILLEALLKRRIC